MSVPLDVERLLAYRIPDARDDYDPRDAILYALGVGAGLSNEVDETAFLYERQLQPLPTMALVLGSPGFWPMDPACGIDWPHVLHGEERLRLLQPIEAFGALLGETRVSDVADKGAGGSALVRTSKELRTPGGTLVGEAYTTWLVRGAGGFDGPPDLPGEVLPDCPARAPDFQVDLPASRNQAAIYRLSGDRNPLHIDAQFARSAGLDQPILHGLSTMGVCARAIIHACCAGNAGMLYEMAVRFTAPVYPGDTIRTFIWQTGQEVQFRAEAVERGAPVIGNGIAKTAL